MRKSLEWKQLSQISLIKNNYLEIIRRSYRFPNGKIANDYYQIVSPNFAVGIVIKGNKTLIQRHFSRGTNQIIYDFPGGIIEKDEDSQTAIIREVSEETGLIVKSIENINLKVYPIPNTMTASGHFFLLEVASKTSQNRYDDEFIKDSWIAIEKLRTCIGKEGYQSINLVVGMYLLDTFIRKGIS